MTASGDVHTADGLRVRWTEFFAERGHTVVPSAGLIPTHPSAPMFTNSGMMQFVPFFLDEEPVPYDPPRATSVQKCVRAGGKHNDLDAIGRSARHLSFFEMLGNFSFGDYNKSEAIPWAWEFLTEVLGLDGERMWVTVHTSDDEAEEIWRDVVQFPELRIQRLGADNFWEMGSTGPCGPSSEIFWDYGRALGPEGGPANPEAEDRFVELWNLVFTQYFRGPDGVLSDLPARNVDTGAGLERILAVLAGSPSLYSADVLTALLETAQATTGVRLGSGELSDIGLRLLADHTRTATFLVADGVVPSNEDRGYVLRRIIRRAVRFAYMLDVEDLIMAPMVRSCVAEMGDAYPDLVSGEDHIVELIWREEDRFRQTLKRGSVLLDAELDSLGPDESLDGDVAFVLHDTYGFPLEVTREMAELRGATVDSEGFETAMEAQRQRSRSAAGPSGVETGADAELARSVLAGSGPTEFVGREVSTVQATVLAVGEDSVYLDRTPFYAESGGQVGDTGMLRTETSEVPVLETVAPLPGLHLHRIPAAHEQLVVGQRVTAEIDDTRRAAIRRNHTATHVLHWALREVLGDHVRQQGSLVGPDRLRFDFSHHGGLTGEQKRRIEDLANQEVLSNAPVEHFETSIDHASELGAIAFFGEKYGEVVRVLRAGDHSIELCGGTHVSALGDIGLVKIISEGSIGSNVRRIEAVTGLGSLEAFRDRDSRLASLAEVLGVPVDDLTEGMSKRLGEVESMRGELKSLRQELAAGQSMTLASTAVDGRIVARVDSERREDVRELALALRDRPGIDVVVLGSSPGGKGVVLVSAVTQASGFHAAELIADAAKMVGGGGGRAADLAMAGGKLPEALDGALDSVRALLGSPSEP